MTVADLLASAADAADKSDWDAAADALADAPATDDVLRRRGWYCSRAKRYEQAIADFALLRSRRPRDYLPPYMIGYQHYQQQNWSDALPYFDEALERQPDHIKSLWRRAYTLHRLGREVMAVASAGRVLRGWHALPDGERDGERRFYAKACHLIARYQTVRDPAGAAALLREAVEHEPHDPYYHYQLAKALRRSGSPDDALRSAESARRLKSNDINIEIEYIDALVSVGRLHDAAACLRKVKHTCSGWVAYRAGTLALRLGDPKDAVDLLRRASGNRETRGEPRVQQVLADALLALESDDTARVDSNDVTASTATAQRHRQRVRRRGSAQPAETSTSGDAVVTGTIDVIREDRNFGFLVDDDGIRRHFRLSGSSSLRKGQRVVFSATTAPKGPAAHHVRPA
jgi:tetratricopeptide (TPR) repeat protein/cold shock CspA family protein